YLAQLLRARTRSWHVTNRRAGCLGPKARSNRFCLAQGPKPLSAKNVHFHLIANIESPTTEGSGRHRRNRLLPGVLALILSVAASVAFFGANPIRRRSRGAAG